MKDGDSSTSEGPSNVVAYGVSGLAVAAAIALRWALDPVVGEHYPYATLFLAVIVPASLFGRGPGIFAVIFGELAANYFLLPPRFSFAIQTRDDLIGLVIDTVLGLVIAFLGGAIYQARMRLERASRAASAQQARLQSTLDTLGEGVIGLDAAGRVTSLNAAAARILEVNHTRALGQLLGSIATLRDGCVILGEARTRPVEVRRTHLRGDSRAPGLSEVLVVVDATERVALSSTRQELELVRLQQNAQIALARERQMQAVIAQAPVAVAMFDRSMRYVVASEKWETSFGLDGRPLAGRLHYDVFPTVSQRWRDTFERCLSGSAERSDEEPVERPDGTTVWYRWQVQPWRVTGEAVEGIVVYSEDITARKLALDALRESEERLRLLLEAATDYAIYMLDPDGRIISWNQGAQRMLGFAADEVLGQAFSTFHPPEKLGDGGAERALRSARERGRFVDEGWRVRKDGSRFWAEGVLFSMHHGDVLRGFAKIMRDTTQRRRAEELQRAVIDNAFDAIVSIDDRGNVESFNNAGERLFGYAADEVIGQNVSVLMPEPHRSEHDGYLRRYLETGEGNIIGAGGRQLTGRRKDGQDFPLELAVTEFRVDSERHFTGILRDLTERRKLEDQLRQAMKMEAIGLLAGGVAHDFNNILFVILGYGQLLLERSGPNQHDQSELLEMLNAAERASELTKQLLMFSRRHTSDSEVVDPHQVVSNLQRMLKRIVGEDIRLHHESESHGLRVRMPASHLEQIVMNIVVNARDAMPNGGELRLRTEEAHLDERYAREHLGVKPGTYLALRVSDTGHGMSEEVRRRIFEPFFTTKDKSRGTGLGLSMVLNVVQQAGGSISVRSQLGQGTTFNIYLPVAQQPAETRVASSERPKQRGAEIVLLVEDEAQVREIAARILTEHGYEVWLACDGADALASYGAKVRSIDLLLTDVIMPNMSGPQLAESLRREHPSLCVLYMSGYTDDALARVQMSDQAQTHFLAKPTTPNGLLAKVREVLEAGQRRDESTQAG